MNAASRVDKAVAGNPELGHLVADLTYINYAVNRDRAPHITPERWKRVYGHDVEVMEARYQADKAVAKAAGGAL